MAKPAYFGRQAFIIIKDLASSTLAVMEVICTHGVILKMPR